MLCRPRLELILAALPLSTLPRAEGGGRRSTLAPGLALPPGRPAPDGFLTLPLPAFGRFASAPARWPLPARAAARSLPPFAPATSLGLAAPLRISPTWRLAAKFPARSLRTVPAFERMELARSPLRPSRILVLSIPAS